MCLVQERDTMTASPGLELKPLSPDFNALINGSPHRLLLREIAESLILTIFIHIVGIIPALSFHEFAVSLYDTTPFG